MTQPTIFDTEPTPQELQDVRRDREAERIRDYQLFLSEMSESELADYNFCFNS